MRIATIDIKGAYFYAAASREMYIATPMVDWEEGDEHRVGRLRFSLYGTRDAAQNWARTFSEHLCQIGFTKGKASPCNFNHEKREIKMLLFDHEKNSKELYEILGDMGWSKEEWHRGFKDEHAAHNMMMSPEPGAKKAKGDGRHTCAPQS